MGTITQMAWKDELLMCGDVLGNVNVWDLKHRKSRLVAANTEFDNLCCCRRPLITSIRKFGTEIGIARKMSQD